MKRSEAIQQIREIVYYNSYSDFVLDDEEAANTLDALQKVFGLQTQIEPDEQVYLHPKTMTIGVAQGNFIEFYWNNKKEESYLPILMEMGEWIYIGDL
jgi:hypothetical protein